MVFFAKGAKPGAWYRKWDISYLTIRYLADKVNRRMDGRTETVANSIAKKRGCGGSVREKKRGLGVCETRKRGDGGQIFEEVSLPLTFFN